MNKSAKTKKVNTDGICLDSGCTNGYKSFKTKVTFLSFTFFNMLNVFY